MDTLKPKQLCVSEQWLSKETFAVIESYQLISAFSRKISVYGSWCIHTMNDRNLDFEEEIDQQNTSKKSNFECACTVSNKKNIYE